MRSLGQFIVVVFVVVLFQVQATVAGESKRVAPIGPSWVIDFLLPNESVFQLIDLGGPGKNLLLHTDTDTLGGRFLSLWIENGRVELEEEFGWVASPFAGPNGYIKIFDSILMETARESIELVASELILGEYIWKVWVPYRPEFPESLNLKGVIAVSLGTRPGAGGREMGIRSTGGQKEVYQLGTRSH